MNIKQGIVDMIKNTDNVKIPDDIADGFYELGYNDEDIQNQYKFHRNDLIDPDDDKLEITPDRVFEYMRSHLEDKGILPKSESQKTKNYKDILNQPDMKEFIKKLYGEEVYNEIYKGE